MTQPLLQAADLRGGARLSADTVADLTGLVEAMHAHVARMPRRPGLDESVDQGERIRSLAGLVYETVRGAARSVGHDAEAVLGWLAPALSMADRREPIHREREAVVSALNGVLGDHLASTDNPLAIAMAFRQSGVPLILERLALRSQLQRPTSKLLVLLHGLCMNDLQWRHADHDHGEALAHELGYTPIRLHYNTGLSVSTNGRILTLLMEKLYDAWPVPIARLAMMGHNMGGLVARSAIHHGSLIQRGRLRWPTRVDDLVCLGTPHQGAPPERAGHGVDLLLGAAPYGTRLARLRTIRSAGINDLRLGNVLCSPTGGNGAERCEPVSLPGDTRCFAMAARLRPAGDDPKATRSDDGWVPVASALGQHPDRSRHLNFSPDRQAVVHDTGHVALLSSAEAYGLLRNWLG